ncbi:MAG: hypothetical protein Q7S84_00675 [bacterium]|nr:hypothetical protein [bacterium]
MDLLSHALWGATIVRKRHLVWWAALFGALPDLVGSAPGFLYLLFARGILWGTDTWQLMPAWTHDAYHLSHSLLGIAVVAVTLACVGKWHARTTDTVRSGGWLILILPFSFHIVLDLFTHVTDPLARLLFPFVAWDAAHVIGVNWWESGWIIATNIATLILMNAFLWRRWRFPTPV